MLCRNIFICSLSERITWERDKERRPWSGTTGTESPACPQQHLSIRCNILTSWKDDLNSYKVRGILTTLFGWKRNFTPFEVCNTCLPKCLPLTHILSFVEQEIFNSVWLFSSRYCCFKLSLQIVQIEHTPKLGYYFKA